MNIKLYLINQIIRLVILGCVASSGAIYAEQVSTEQQLAPQDVMDFYAEVMNAPAYMPADLSSQQLGGVLPKRSEQQLRYLTASDVDYFKAGWEQRIASDWQFFSAPTELGRILIIDLKATDNDNVAGTDISPLSYRYLANKSTQNELYEPWSSSKIFAYSAAVAKVRQLSEGNIGAASLAGSAPIADLITSINSYETFGQADGDSNAIATYFANVTGRDRLTALFHDQWLLLANPAIRFRGAYSTKVFAPSDTYWHSAPDKISVSVFTESTIDTGYQGYRCEHCGLTGNKPMTTLAQAEWLKRLAVHERDPLTRHPYLQTEDVKVLFFGSGHSDKQHQVGGMMQGISLMLHNAVATAIAGELPADPKKVLDDATKGQWRIWQKIGWGPSETRGAGENVVLAHVSLPHYQGGKEFTIAAQTAAAGDGEIYVNYAGIKMQSLLSQSLLELFNSQQP
jgi:hypothetical protein